MIEFFKINGGAANSASFKKESITHISLESESETDYVVTITTTQPYKYHFTTQEAAQALFNSLNKYLES